MKAGGVLLAPIAATLVLVFSVVLVLAPVQPNAVLTLAASGCLSPDTSTSGNRPILDAEQTGVARAIVAVGREFDVPARGWVIAIATGLQESGLRPLPYGDRDSLGVFQQRASWGPAAVRLDPVASAKLFFLGGLGGQRGLVAVPGWQAMPVAVAAQAVQVSAYPDALRRDLVRFHEQQQHLDSRANSHQRGHRRDPTHLPR